MTDSPVACGCGSAPQARLTPSPALSGLPASRSSSFPSASRWLDLIGVSSSRFPPIPASSSFRRLSILSISLHSNLNILASQSLAYAYGFRASTASYKREMATLQSTLTRWLQRPGGPPSLPNRSESICTTPRSPLTTSPSAPSPFQFWRPDSGLIRRDSRLDKDARRIPNHAFTNGHKT
ncbi:hypothetical protein BDW72DRAFT_94035 [Aspergillus terricola var. indicus]